MAIHLEMPLEKLRENKLFIATPMYGGNCVGIYTRSMMELTAKMCQYGVAMQPYFLFNESLITRARNYCLPRSSQVLTENGLMTIGEIVDKKYSGNVWSCDSQGVFSWKPVIGWSKRENISKKKWVSVKTNNTTISKKRLICTEDHEIAVIDSVISPGNISFLPAKESIGKYSVRLPNEIPNNRTRENSLYNKDHLSILGGILLGDGHINKNGVFTTCHGPKQHTYSEYIASIFSANITDSFGTSGFVDDSDYHTKTVNINANEQTKIMREWSYGAGNKRVTTELLNLIDEKGLAFWYMDDGYLVTPTTKGPYATLCTQSFSEQDNEKLVNWLDSKFGVKASVRYNSVTDKHFIEFGVPGTKRLMELIAPYVIEDMAYKVPNEFHDMIATGSINHRKLDYSASMISDIEYLKENDSRGGALYDIMVEDNHNFIANGSLVHNCVDEFLRSDCTHLLFIDSDIGFNADDAVALLALQIQNEDFDIIGGPYPKKTIAWEKIKMAVDKGFADEDPNSLERFVGDYVFNPKGNAGRIPLGQPVEVLEIGTGFMMIRRKTFEKFQEHFSDEYMYKPDHVRTEHFDGKREIMQFFQAEIDRPNPVHVLKEIEQNPKEAMEFIKKYHVELSKASKRYLSEDYWWCQRVQSIGLKTWLCPWMKLQHAGSYVFGSTGGLVDLAELGASATADAGQLDEIKERKKQRDERLKRGPKKPS